MSDPKSVSIAVALLMIPGKGLVLTWNDKWEAFVLPMTKIKSGPPVESGNTAAIRAAAEAVRLPIQCKPEQASKEMRTLQLSLRNDEVKDYRFTVVPVDIHPDFTLEVAPSSTICCSVEKLMEEAYQPVSPSVLPILKACLEWNWL